MENILVETFEQGIAEGTYWGQPYKINVKTQTDAYTMLTDEEIFEVVEHIDLFSSMKKVVDSKMECYKTDLEMDKNIILNSQGNTYYWFVRSTGTDTYDEGRLGYHNSEDYTSANYFLGSGDLSIFKVSVYGRENDKVYGNLKKITKNRFKKVLANPKIIEGALAEVIFGDGTSVRGEVPGFCEREVLENLLKINKRVLDDVKRLNILSYVGDKVHS